MNDNTGQVRMSDRTGDPQFDHQPPAVVWLCTKRHRMLRVFRTHSGWHLLGERFRVPMREWLDRVGAGWTADDVHDGRVVAMGGRWVSGHDRMLPLDIDAWPSGSFELGCRCQPVKVELALLADDCRRARDERRRVERTIG